MISKFAKKKSDKKNWMSSTNWILAAAVEKKFRFSALVKWEKNIHYFLKRIYRGQYCAVKYYIFFGKWPHDHHMNWQLFKFDSLCHQILGNILTKMTLNPCLVRQQPLDFRGYQMTQSSLQWSTWWHCSPFLTNLSSSSWSPSKLWRPAREKNGK